MSEIFTPILIADAGSTKVAWKLMLLSQNPGESPCCPITLDVSTPGINAVHSSDSLISESIREAAAKLSEAITSETELSPDNAKRLIANVNQIYFYGAGCRGEKACGRISSELERHFGAKKIEVASDLLCAARALLGKEEGIIAILGTGSNSALYDGNDFIENTPALGYILGDEGSGAYIGKRLLSDIFKGVCPDIVSRTIIDERSLSLDDVITTVYRSDAPAAFLASFTRDLSEILKWKDSEVEEKRIGADYAEALLSDAFETFVRRNLLQYLRTGVKPEINAVGSIAKVFRKQLEAGAARCGFSLGKILASPIEDLCQYHLNEFQNENRKH